MLALPSMASVSSSFSSNTVKVSDACRRSELGLRVRVRKNPSLQASLKAVGVRIRVRVRNSPNPNPKPKPSPGLLEVLAEVGRVHVHREAEGLLEPRVTPVGRGRGLLLPELEELEVHVRCWAQPVGPQPQRAARADRDHRLLVAMPGFGLWLWVGFEFGLGLGLGLGFRVRVRVRSSVRTQAARARARARPRRGSAA